MEASSALHPAAGVLKAFASGRLDDAAAETVMSHLDGCPDCCRAVAASSGDDFLARLRQARGRSGTPAPTQTLSQAGRPAPPAASQTALPNLPPQLASDSQYEVLRELGRGGMGVVYLARNKLMDRVEVLKVVNKALLDRPGAVERFLREIRSAAKLAHPNVVAAYTALQLGEVLAFAMEYVEGEDLASLVKSRGPLPVATACFYAQQAALGLQHAHEKGMVHRDIKPQNLMLARQGKKHVVKVLDFGLAKATREKADDMELTGEGKMLGTPDYIAPEQTLDATHADIRADVYSLGCTLYYLLTGAPPFKGRSLYEVLQAHHSTEARPLNLVRPEAPEELAAVVRKMMAKDSAKRFQTPMEVVKALSPFVGQGAKGAPPKSAPELSVGAAGTKTERPTAPAAKGAREKAAVPEPPTAGGWNTLTAGRHVSRAPKVAAIRKRRPPAAKPAPWKKWLIGGGVAVGVLLLVLGGLWAAGVFKEKTKDGTIVLENLPPDATVTVDDENVKLETTEGQTFAISITAEKKHRLQVKTKDGLTLLGEDVQIDAGGRRAITLRYEPAPVKDSLDLWLAVGTRWEGKIVTTEPRPGETAVWFTVNSRDGNKFRGRYVGENRGDRTVEGVLKEDHSFTWKFVDQAVNEWSPDRVSFESIEATGTWEDDRVHVDWKWPRPDGQLLQGFIDFTARRVISNAGEGDEWPPSLDPGKADCSHTGTWRVQGEELIQQDVVQDVKNPAWVRFGDLSWQEYDIRMKAMKTQGEGGFIVVFDELRHSKLTQWLIGVNGNRDSYVETLDLLPTGDRSTPRAGPTPGSVANNQWYEIHIKARGKRLECFLDGQRQFQFTDPDRRGGRVAITCSRMAARFKDIEITAADGKVLWKGPPKLAP